MSTTLRDVIDGVLMRASLEAGVDTNMYADDGVAQIVQSTFDDLFDKWWWPQFYTPNDTSFTLDGVTGKITGDISSNVKRYIDIRFVWLGNYSSPLPRINSRLNPSLLRRPGIGPVNDKTKVFMITPTDTTLPITIAYRTKPDDFIGDDAAIDFDKELLVLGAAYDYVNSLGLNPGAEDKLQERYQSRLQMLQNELQSADVPMGPANYVPQEWNWY